jgi:hypothetical protein
MTILHPNLYHIVSHLNRTSEQRCIKNRKMQTWWRAWRFRRLEHGRSIRTCTWLLFLYYQIVQQVTIQWINKRADQQNNHPFFVAEGKHLAVKFACKYIEVSAILDHKVSELLVGIVRQIRLQRLKHSRDVNEGSGDLLTYTGCLHRTAFDLFRRIFRRNISTTSKSCDNLLIWSQVCWYNYLLVLKVAYV